MTISTIINNSLTGIFTSQAALRTITDNVSNVNTEGYARKVVRLDPKITGAQGAGVDITSIERVVDNFLVKSSYETSAEASRYELENTFHARMQALLGRPDVNSSLSGKMNNIFTTMSELALNPLSTILKESTVTSINSFGTELGMIAENIQSMRLDASTQISETIEKINGLVRRVEYLNPLIVKETVTTGDAGALIEQRSQALSELSKLIDINIVEVGNNKIEINTKSGLSLLGNVRRELQYNTPGLVSSATPFPPITVHDVDPTSGNVTPTGLTLDGNISSGEIYGLMHLRDVELVAMSEELGALGAAVMHEFNKVHNENTAAPPPNSLTGINTGMLATDPHRFTGESTFAITDANGNLVDSVTIDFGVTGPNFSDVISAVNAGLAGNGSMALTNGVLTFSATNGSNGVSISQVAGNESDRAGKGFSHFFGMNDLVQAREMGMYKTGIDATDAHGLVGGSTINLEIKGEGGIDLASYTYTVTAGQTYNDILTDLNASSLGAYMNFAINADGEFTSTPNAGYPEAKLHVKSDSTSRGTTAVPISDFLGMDSRYKIDAAFDFSVVDRINDDVNLLSLARFDDTALVGGTAISFGDQRGGIALQDIENATVNIAAAGGLNQFNSSLGQYAAAVLADFGFRAQLAESFGEDSNVLLGEINQRIESISGVNVDEELSNMIVFQNAYSSSARMLNVAKEMYDELIGLIQ
ncbi:flagellar hook-associated protein FlgK [Pseudemcibacter aquimaris]|uniref:flagellar hook-associated protein FlgK n=1 Tax=Pseudemcibacter aquimaris TaxID=2857064 RepID=UPI00201294AB|nr:flagellar hook-associated protein FlgK [Pseudemcibacter aquimaris]MCC3862225.1 flagellar hook-associated protein FlgK [Pseudemcibacter aquimaris]WDU58977.1 flagellar hook-associated protein FlgK [Pseudemcibacter aquimaris]